MYLTVFSRRGVAYLSEQPYFYSHLTCYESLEFAIKLMGVDISHKKSEIFRVLDIVELSHKAKSRIKELSKGMQQRLNMAQAMLGKPHLMILDEPMSGMDPPGRRLFRSVFKSLVESGTTVFFSTHVLEDIESVCDEVVVLSKGNVTYCGAVNDLLEKGIKGIEMHIPSCEFEIKSVCQNMGCQIESDHNGILIILIPRQISPSEIQKYLSSKGIFPSKIVTRSESLEGLLYSNTHGDKVL